MPDKSRIFALSGQSMVRVISAGNTHNDGSLIAVGCVPLLDGRSGHLVGAHISLDRRSIVWGFTSQNCSQM